MSLICSIWAAQPDPLKTPNRKTIRSSLKLYERRRAYTKPKLEKVFNNYIIILITIRLLNNKIIHILNIKIYISLYYICMCNQYELTCN